MTELPTNKPQGTKDLSPVPESAEIQRFFQRARFTESAPKLSLCPDDIGAEIAFAGRSNAGKSSAINKITSQKKLARTSKTPGRTQLINFFELDQEKRLVDLPGYGYAKVAQSKKLEWQKHLLHYLEERRSLNALILVMDARHPLQAFDTMMLDWVKRYQMPCHILLTKSDKLSRNEGKKALFSVEKAVKDLPFCTAQLFSSHDGTGLDEARAHCWQYLNPPIHD